MITHDYDTRGKKHGNDSNELLKKTLVWENLENYNLELIHLKKMGFFLEKEKCSIQYSDVKLA